MISRTGDITANGAMVVGLGMPVVARMGDITVHALWGARMIITGSPVVLSQSAPVARQGDITASGAMVVTGHDRTVEHD